LPLYSPTPDVDKVACSKEATVAGQRGSICTSRCPRI